MDKKIPNEKMAREAEANAKAAMGFDEKLGRLLTSDHPGGRAFGRLLGTDVSFHFIQWISMEKMRGTKGPDVLYGVLELYSIQVATVLENYCGLDPNGPHTDAFIADLGKAFGASVLDRLKKIT